MFSGIYPLATCIDKKCIYIYIYIHKDTASRCWSSSRNSRRFRLDHSNLAPRFPRHGPWEAWPSSLWPGPVTAGPWCSEDVWEPWAKLDHGATMSLNFFFGWDRTLRKQTQKNKEIHWGSIIELLQMECNKKWVLLFSDTQFQLAASVYFECLNISHTDAHRTPWSWVHEQFERWNPQGQGLRISEDHRPQRCLVEWNEVV